MTVAKTLGSDCRYSRRWRTLYADESVLVLSGRPTWRDSRFLRNFERAPNTDKICRVGTTQQLPFALLPVQVTSKKRTALCMLLGWCFFSHYTRDQGCEFSQISPQIIFSTHPPSPTLPHSPTPGALGSRTVIFAFIVDIPRSVLHIRAGRASAAYRKTEIFT